MISACHPSINSLTVKLAPTTLVVGLVGIHLAAVVAQPR